MPASNPPDNLRFLPLLESHPDVIWMSSADGSEIHYCSSAFERVYGLEPRALYERPSLWLELVHPGDRELAAASFRELLRTGNARATYRIVRPDGELRWIDDRKVLCAGGPAGPATFLGGIARDVTAATQSQQLARLQQSVLRRVALHERRDDVLAELCRRLEDIVPEAVATILLLDGQRLLRVAAAPGCSAELVNAIDGLVPGDNVGSCGTAAFTGMPCIVHDTATDPRWASLREAAVHFGIRSCWSFPILAGSGGVVGTIAISSFVHRAPTGFHLALLETATQLTAIVIQHDLAQQQQLAATSAARSAMQARTELLANVSHELRTPLTAILGFADLALDGAPASLIDDCLRTIRANGEHLLEVINDLLDIAKVEAGGIEVEQQPCSLRQILEEALRLFELPIQARGLHLCVEGADRLPASVATDPTRLRQILVNLLSNAVKFTEAGEIAVRCASEPLGSRVQVEFAVTDSGIGMTREQIERAFTPFCQGDASTTRRFGGTGLGLSLSRQLARLLDGEILVESEFGCGSTFTLRFAAGLAAPSRPGDCAADAAAEQPARPLQCRVLVAEDTHALRRLAESVLRKAGAEVVVVQDGATACAAVLAAERGEPFDLVLMDMQMPIMDGYAATRALRRDGYTRPIVALTARAQDSDREQCLAAGCTAYLSKPLSLAELVRTVAALTSPRPTP
ncbi:MAG TPA: ATP-binding protein [Planctomycetota bacterium]|nr:ATP-binding protein [Planctomycetota bacterium]